MLEALETLKINATNGKESFCYINEKQLKALKKLAKREEDIINGLEKDLKTLWNVCWNNDTEMTSYQSEIFDKYYDKFHKKN